MKNSQNKVSKLNSVTDKGIPYTIKVRVIPGMQERVNILNQWDIPH